MASKRRLLSLLPAAHLNNNQFRKVFDATVKHVPMPRKQQQCKAASSNNAATPPHKRAKLQPNYFVAVQINSPNISAELDRLQRHMVDKCDRLARVLTRNASAHLTLCVVKLDEIHCIHDASQAIKRAVDDFTADDGTAVGLSLRGVDHFGQQVVFVNVKPDEQLNRLHALAGHVRRCLTASGVPITDDRPFSPHLTVAKLSAHPPTRSKLRKIPVSSFAEFSAHTFGTQIIDGVQLCAMTIRDNATQYYWTPCTVSLPAAEQESAADENSVKDDVSFTLNSLVHTIAVSSSDSNRK